jgi:hypothetical protein
MRAKELLTMMLRSIDSKYHLINIDENGPPYFAAAELGQDYTFCGGCRIRITENQ